MTTIKLKNGSGAPSAGNLVQGEPALDLTNKRLYTENSSGAVIEVGTNPTSLTTGTFTSTGIDDNAASTAITIDSSQNVGIGASSPANPLEIQHGTVGTGNGSNNTLALRYNSTTLYGQHYMDANGLYHILADNSGSAGGNMQLDADTTIRLATGSTPTERMRIDSSGNLLVSKTGTANLATDTTAGHTLYGIGIARHVASGSPSLQLTRTSSDGDIAVFTKDGTTVGSIATVGGNRIAIGSSDVGLFFDSVGNELEPWSLDTGAVRDAAINIGRSGGRFKDLFLSGTARANQVRVGSALSAASPDYTFQSDSSMGMFRLPGVLGFSTVGAERIRLDASGNLLVGTTAVSSQATGVSSGVYFVVKGDIVPSVDAGITGHSDLGDPSTRFEDAYVRDGVTTGSDGRDKQDIEELSEAEQRVAVACKGLLRKWRWIDAVEAKGDDARIHFGIIAQDLQDAFTAEGLDAGRYAMFINSTWTDEETGEERSRMGVRYSELLAFIIAAI